MSAKKAQEIDMLSQELENLKNQSIEYQMNGNENDKKKKIVISVCIIAAVLIVGLVVGYFIISSKQSPISYGPNATAEEMTDEITKMHEERIKKIDENGGVREGVNYVATHAEFDENGDLIVDGYFRNFTGHEIYNISGNVTLTSTNNQENIGGAFFEFPEKEFGSLKNGKSRPWRLVFENDYVNVEVVDLSSFTVFTELEYYQK